MAGPWGYYGPYYGGYGKGKGFPGAPGFDFGYGPAFGHPVAAAASGKGRGGAPGRTSWVSFIANTPPRSKGIQAKFLGGDLLGFIYSKYTFRGHAGKALG